MEFVETTLFTQKLPSYLSDDEYREFQNYVHQQPEAGDVIKGSGGVRKIRWKTQGKGKRGGVRIIYYLEHVEARFLMLTLYAKNELDDLTQAEIKVLKKIVEEWDNG
jgi:hypothetical protein